MKISEKTKISQLIKENPEAIHTIASINKHFKKLNNPVLRKILATRVTIADAAKIGGTSVDVFFEKLKAIGFETDLQIKETQPITETKQATIMEHINKEMLVEMDVRPTIEAGNDPFKEIMEAIKVLPDDKTLLIINVFEPIPLINHLKEKGYESKTERPEQGVVHTYFRKSLQTSDETLPEIEQSELNDFELAVSEFGENIKTIDVRHLEMPEPMVTILQETENLPEGHALFVSHKRIPQFLLPELKKREFTILSHELDENNLNLLIFKKK